MRCVPIDHDGPTWCLECGVDTWEIGEFSYMVRKDVWLVPWNTDGGMSDFLCIGCLEKRVGCRTSSPTRIRAPTWRRSLEEPADLLVRPLEGRAVLDAQGGAYHEREHREGYEVDKDEAHLLQMILAGCR
jgi:hypothetical protein